MHRSSAWGCLVLLAALGCGEKTPPEGATGAGPPRLVMQRSGEDLTYVCIFEGQDIALKQLVASGRPAYTSEPKRRDFNGDGVSEYVFHLWCGGNRTDELLVIGKRRGRWSLWARLGKAFADPMIEDYDGDGKLDIRVQVDGRTRTYFYRNGCFVERAGAPGS